MRLVPQNLEGLEMYYMVVELLPYETIDRYPSGLFSEGHGFESEGTEFSVYGPEATVAAFAGSCAEYEQAGYSVSFVLDKGTLVC